MANCTPKSGGQFELESGGQFAPKLVVNLDWKVVVNLTGFSTIQLMEKNGGRHVELHVNNKKLVQVTVLPKL
jgi:hypothetical protein